MTPRDDIDFARSRAILLGTSRYTAGLSAMPAAANSLTAMRTALTGPCGWPADRVTELRDKSIHDAVLPDMAELIHDTADVLLLYYVGHGQLLSGNDLGLALTDTSQDPKKRLSTSLQLSQLRRELRESDEIRVKILILDCCCSGIAVRFAQGPAAADKVHQAAKLEGEGSYTLTACGHAQDAYFEPGPRGLTYFTKFFTQALSEGIENGAAHLTLSNLRHEVERRYKKSNVEGTGVKPETAIRFEGPADAFVFAPNRAYAPRPTTAAAAAAAAAAPPLPGAEPVMRPAGLQRERPDTLVYRPLVPAPKHSAHDEPARLDLDPWNRMKTPPPARTGGVGRTESFTAPEPQVSAPPAAAHRDPASFAVVGAVAALLAGIAMLVAPFVTMGLLEGHHVNGDSAALAPVGIACLASLVISARYVLPFSFRLLRAARRQ